VRGLWPFERPYYKATGCPALQGLGSTLGCARLSRARSGAARVFVRHAIELASFVAFNLLNIALHFARNSRT
jgi:hypothetical protein